MSQTPQHSPTGQPIGAPVVGWEPRPWPAPVRLEGRYVDVVPLTSARYAELFAALCGEDDDDIWTYRDLDRPATLSALWMHLAGKVDDEAIVSFALVPREGQYAGRAAGLASYQRISPAHGSVEIAGVVLAHALQRTRVGTEAVHLLIAHAFEDLGYRRFEWKCDSLNEPSRRAAVRFGFSYEGRHRNAMVYKDRTRDTDWFSITDEEWPAIGRRHRAWLDPANFDADGQQVTRLSLTP